MISTWGFLCLVVGALAEPASRHLQAQALSNIFSWDAANDPTAVLTIVGPSGSRTYGIRNVPAVEFQKAIVTVELSKAASVGLNEITIELGYPTGEVDLIYQLTLAQVATCLNVDNEINLIFDPSATLSVVDCVQYDASAEPVRVRPIGNTLLYPGATGLGQQPASETFPLPVNGLWGAWQLRVFNTDTAAGSVTFNSWSIQFEVFCYSRVSNAVGTLGSGIGFTNPQTVQCQSGFVATSSSLTCSINGPSANACILGGAGGALVTWGVNNDIEGLLAVPDCMDYTVSNCFRTTHQLGRDIPVNRFLLFDRLMRYAWLPNGLIVTQVALSDWCTLALDREGRVFMWGRIFPETAIGIAQQIPDNARKDATQIAFPADARITQIYAGSYSNYAALAAGGSLWMWGYNYAGSLGLPLTTEYSLTPVSVNVPTGSRIVHVGLTYGGTAIVTHTGELWMWGTNEYFNNGTTYNLLDLITANGGGADLGDLNGIGPITDAGINTENLIQNVQSPIPVRVGGSVLPASVVEVVLMEYQTIARTKDGSLWYWGVEAFTYYFQRRDSPSSFPNAGSGLPLATALPAGDRSQQALNPLIFDASEVNLALNGDFINIRQRDAGRLYKALSAYGGSVAALTTAGEVYTWGIDVFIYWPLFIANEDQQWTAPFYNEYLQQRGVLGRNLPATATAANVDLLYWLDDSVGRINLNRQFIQIAQGGSFGIALDTTGKIYQWGSQFVDNYFLAPLAATASPADTSGSAENTEKVLPVGDVITILAAGSYHAAGLDLRYLEQGCPITKPLMTSQDINFIRGLTNAQRGKFVASTTVTTVCRYDNPNWINHFVNVRHLLQVGSLPLAAVMPPNSNGVTIVFTSLGHGYYAVITTFTPTGTSMAALGITAVESRQIKFIVAVEQMFPDATMFITNPITMQVSVAGLENVYCYDNNFRRGQLLAMPWGVWSYSNNVATVTMQNPSACVGYGEINTDESNEGLLGLLALIALPVICLLGCYIWLWYRYTNTAAVVEAANPMQPVYLLQPAPMVVPSPAPQYMQMPAYIPQASYMAPPYMGY